MAGQGVERREVLRIMALAAGASGYPGFSRWAFACGHGNGRVDVRPARYAPQFFSPAEYATVERLAELILPSDGTPGAREAGVAEFIDFMVASDPEVQYRFRYGLVWLEAHARQKSSRPFVEMDEAQQTALLEPLAYEGRRPPGEDEGRAFFKKMREYTVMGFYTSRIGLAQLDYPGLRIYAESPGCPHPDDPDHRHLPVPKA
jgi:gluconate 2-dehydrogenase gamma chain